MPRHEAVEHNEPPSPQALIERQRAEAAAARNPLAFSMGEPLPGRSMLDKLRARQALDDAQRDLDDALDAGVGDNVIALNRRQYGRTNRISPGAFIRSGRTLPPSQGH